MVTVKYSKVCRFRQNYLDQRKNACALSGSCQNQVVLVKSDSNQSICCSHFTHTLYSLNKHRAFETL